jgi:putative peptide zinc metalloprotease protein
MTKRLTLLLTTVATLVALAGAPPAVAQDNAAVAINTEDGTSVFDFAFKVSRVMNDVVDNQNAAVAYASCEECQTVAVAIQIVLVYSDPTEVTPENYAIALNEGCDTCETVASAYQFVLSVPDRFRFSKEAWRRIVEIRKEIRELGKAFERGELSALELQELVDTLADELRTVIKEDIAAGGADADKPRPEAGDEADGDELAPADENTEEESDEDEGVETGETETVPTETVPTETTTTP